MPVERSRGSRRSGADGNQLVWTVPVEPPSSTGVSFTPNVTPITFSDPDTDALEPDLFPFASDPPSPRRPAHSKKKAENHIPRPPNAFILFRSSFIKGQHVSTEVETNHSTLSKIIGLTWQNLREDERQVWHLKAKAALDDHRRKFPQYAFRPLHTKSKGGTDKRKVREVGPKDLKRCAKIAELLVEGKKGTELNVAIQEFDKHHVPEVATRFEAPMTERTFRRSSSVKVEDCGETQHPPPTTPHREKSPSSSPSPPLVDRDAIPPYSFGPSSSTEYLPPASPYTSSDGNYLFPEKGESTFDPSTFSYSSSSSSSLHASINPPVDEDITSAFRIFQEDTFGGALHGRPSLSIDTSYPDPPYWSTRSSSPTSIPSTPCYPVSPMTGQYNSYSHSLRHTSSNLSLESTSSFDSNSSYEDFSSSSSSHSYPAKDYIVDPSLSLTSTQPYTHTHTHTQYSQQMPIFIASSDCDVPADFVGVNAYDPSMVSSSPIDDVSFAKLHAQYPYLSPTDSLNLDFSTFSTPSLSLSQC
ncbi:hypothetical protein D9757_014348 [Collybiopsis confluens]|uniref:HMG box domain-containing protein n=1 Tax=Collybiopsis confluens TaxID=2823264 RepID=A0A8H5CUM1_9AGAR|nr:hypothetical protein D9757_014348 [Collybiopsis confluens]